MDLDDINKHYDEYQDFQDDLITRNKKLKILTTYNLDTDNLLELLSEVKTTPILLDKKE